MRLPLCYLYQREGYKLKPYLLSMGLAATVLSSALPAVTFAAAPTLQDITNKNPGEVVTIQGTASSSDLMIKVVNPNHINLFFDVVKPASNGDYSSTFTIPQDAATGTYHVVVGEGSQVASDQFTLSVNTGGNLGGSSSSLTPAASTPNTPSTLPVKEFKPSDIPTASNGKLSLEIKGESRAEVVLPANITELVGENKLEIKLDEVTVEVPKEVLSELNALLPGAKVSFKVDKISEDTAKEKLSAVQEDATLSLAGEIFDFQLSVVAPDGKTAQLTTFEKPITVSLKVDSTANRHLVGIYYIANNEIKFVGGQLNGDTITANLDHFSQYGVLEYDKSYSDVPASHWAHQTIKELSAKHIVKGISEDLFAPTKDVTRAEFAVLLANALQLKASGATPFADIPAQSWYADGIAAVYESGIAKGRTATSFAPNQKISRQELAVMAVKAVEFKTKSSEGKNAADFTDKSLISDWAKESVDAAVQHGLMKGRDKGRFAPLLNTNRAEATQVIYNIFNK